MKKLLVLSLMLLAVACMSAAREIVVNSTADSGTGTLRRALQTARFGDTIIFDTKVFPPSTPATIYIREELPFVVQGNLLIDASNVGVILDGSHASSNCMVGLEIHSDNNIIRGLRIVNFENAVGIILSGGAQNNTIGGDRGIGSGPLGQGNLLSGNERGIGLWDEGVAFNTITGNLIGTDATGENPHGNLTSGICILNGAQSNTIGPDNIIAFNLDAGIEIAGGDTFGNTLHGNSIHNNGGFGILLLEGGNTELAAPEILTYDLQAGIASGSACPECTAEIYSTQTAQGEVYEGSAVTDERGNFILDKGSPFSGPLLTATTTSAGGNTSAFSMPTVGGSLKLQEGAGSLWRRLALNLSSEVQDNRIGTLMDLNERFYDEMDVARFVRTHEEIGVKRIRLLLDDGDFPFVDWSTQQGSTRLEPRQVSTIASFFDAGIEVMCGLIFWDIDAQGKKETTGYSRFRTEEDVVRYLEFVQETARQLRGSVAYYELLNGPNTGSGTQQYVRLSDYLTLVERVVPIIREEDPGAKIAVGAVAHIQEEGWGGMGYLFDLLESRVMPLVDAITFHPMYNVTPQNKEIQQYYYGYSDLLHRIWTAGGANGFRGEYIADELTWWSPNEDIPVHPPLPRIFSEAEAAKYYARAIVLHLGMNVTALVRLMPDFRNLETRVDQSLCMVMAGHEAIDIPVELDIDFNPIAHYGFRFPNGDRLLAIWTDGIAVDDDPGVPATIMFPEMTATQVVGIDILHGLEQELIFETVGDGFHQLGEPGSAVTSGGGSDRDGDGVPDDEDLCPDWPGSPEASGC